MVTPFTDALSALVALVTPSLLDLAMKPMDEGLCKVVKGHEHPKAMFTWKNDHMER